LKKEGRGLPLEERPARRNSWKKRLSKGGGLCRKEGKGGVELTKEAILAFGASAKQLGKESADHCTFRASCRSSG